MVRFFRHSGFAVILIFPVIPAPAGIYARRFPVIPAQAGIYALRFARHSGFSPVIPAQAGIYARRFPHHSGFRRNPRATIFRHSGASRNLRAAIFRHSGASRNLRVAICPVIPAQAGIYALRWTPVFAAMTAPYPNHPKKHHRRRWQASTPAAPTGLHRKIGRPTPQCATRGNRPGGGQYGKKCARPRFLSAAALRPAKSPSAAPNPANPDKIRQNSAPIPIDKRQFRPLY